jgi:probable F420-dependent oxidoreductase
MKISLFAPLANPIADADYLRELGTCVDELGFHSVWLAEHVVLFDEYKSRYPYAADGRIPAGGENGIIDPFTALSFLAAVTKRVRLGSGICLVPQRNPVYTAKETASIDWLSGGRLDFGVGIGWLAEEFEATATPFEKRADRCRSYLEVIRRLWCDPVSEYEDEYYRLPACRQYPKPVQTPHPPIFFGGESNPALRRVADLGQGWYGFNLEPEQLKERLATLHGLLAERGRSRSEIEVVVSPYLLDCDFEKVERYREAGADQVVLVNFSPGREALRGLLEGLAEQFVEPARAL